MLKYFQIKYMTQELCNKAVVFLPTFKFVPDWFVTNKILEKLGNVVFSNDDTVFGNADSGNVTFFSDDVGLVHVDLNNVSPDNVNFADNDPENIIHFRLTARCKRWKQQKACKKRGKKLLPIAWHPTRWWDWCMSEDEKKK